MSMSHFSFHFVFLQLQFLYKFFFQECSRVEKRLDLHFMLLNQSFLLIYFFLKLLNLFFQEVNLKFIESFKNITCTF